MDDTEMIDGLVLNQTVIKSSGGPTRVEKARIALIQFQLSPPKPDMENQIVVNDYRQMDKILKEERTYLLNMVKKIQKGEVQCTVYSEVNPAGCGQRPVIALSVKAEDHGNQRYRA